MKLVKAPGEMEKKKTPFSRAIYFSNVSIHQTFPVLELLGPQGTAGILSDTTHHVVTSA